MKKIIIVITVLLPMFLYSTSLSHKEITKMVSKIKGERAGISLDILDTTPNPFALIEKKVKEVKEVKVEKPKFIEPAPVYTMTAVLNHAAFINKKWYRVGDKLGGYKVIQIGKTYAILKSDKETKKLVIPPRKKKFKMFKGN